MEENIIQEQLTEIQSQPTKPWLKIALLAVLGLVLAGGLVFAGMQIAKSSNVKTQKSKPNLKSQNLTPTLALISTPTLDSTANWETYTNTKYGYSIRYPPPAAAVEHPPVSEERIQEIILSFYGGYIDSSGFNGLKIILIVVKNPDQKTPMQFAQEKYNQTEEMIINKSLEGDISKCKVEPVIRSKTNGARFTSCSTPTAGGGILNFSEWYVKNGVTYEIYAVLIDKNYLTIFDQILSTFRFLD